MRRVVTGAVAALMLGLSGFSVAVAEPLYRFKVGSWDAGAYSRRDSRQFNHCAGSATYNSGVSVVFAVGRDYGWSMMLANPDWTLTRGRSYNLGFSVDGDVSTWRTGTAITSNGVEIELPPTSEVFQQFRRGHTLQVTVASGRSFYFNLTDTSILLPALLRCVYTNLNPQPAPTTTSNPFVSATSPAATNPAKERTPVHRAEAVAFVANMLGAAGISGFKILDESKGSDSDAVWTIGSDTFGTLRIDTENAPTVISVATIAVDGATCKSKFMSGSMPPDAKDKTFRLFTKCGEGTEAITMYYFVIPRKRGGHYLVGTGAVGSDEPARKTESDVRAAAFTLSGK